MLLRDPPHRKASAKGRDARIVARSWASGSYLRYGLEVKLYKDTASGHKKLALWRGKKYAACLLFYFPPLLVICFISSHAPHPIHVQLCLHSSASWWDLLNIYIHHVSV